jgi:hypothetical protein
MQADGLRATGTFAWVVHDALSTVALGSADGRADQALRAASGAREQYRQADNHDNWPS